MDKAKNILKIIIYSLTALVIILEITISLQIRDTIKEQITPENVDRILRIIERQQEIQLLEK